MTAQFPLFALCLWLWPAPPVWAAGAAGADFLKIVPSPRAVGMGESGAGICDDVLAAMALNPACLSRLAYSEVATTYNKWLEGVSMQHAAFAYPTARRGAFAFSGTMLEVAPFAGYDNSGASAGKVSARDLALKAAYANRLWGPAQDRRFGLFAGAGLKQVSSRLETAQASSLMLDAGLLYAGRLGPGMAGLGASAHSLGQGLQFDAERDPPPTIHRLGLGYTLPVFGDPLTWALDFKKPIDDSLSFSFGAEYVVKRVLAWRLGFAPQTDLGGGFRFGVGFDLKVLSVDYALSPTGDFGATHLIGLSARFGRPIERLPVLTPDEEKSDWHLERGRKLLNEGRPYDAAFELSEALRLNPYNKKALLLLRKARDAVERLK